MLRFYFGGREAEADGGFTFGLAPTERALDAYLELLGDCPLPWSVTVVGGDLFATDLPELALAEAVTSASASRTTGAGGRATRSSSPRPSTRVRASGREVADCTTAAAFLGSSSLTAAAPRWARLREGDTVRARTHSSGGPPCTSTT